MEFTFIQGEGNRNEIWNSGECSRAELLFAAGADDPTDKQPIRLRSWLIWNPFTLQTCRFNINQLAITLLT